MRTRCAGMSSTQTSLPFGLRLTPWLGACSLNVLGVAPKLTVASTFPPVTLDTWKPRFLVAVVYTRLSDASTVNGRTRPPAALSENRYRDTGAISAQLAA